MAESNNNNFNLLLLDSVDTIFKMQSMEDKKSFQYKFLHVHLLGNINKMCEVIHD